MTIEWIMQAQGANRELDGLLAIAFDGFLTISGRFPGDPPQFVYTDAEGVEHRPGYGGMQLVPHYTGSLEQAVALAERVMPGVWWVVGKGQMRESDRPYGCQLLFGTEPLASVEANTAPMAVIAALLLANPAKDIDPR